MLPMLSANLLLAIIATEAIAPADTATPPLTDFDTVHWSLDRLGTERATLKVPSAYGTGSPIARKFSAAVEAKHHKFSDQTFQVLLIHAMWPGLEAMSPDWHELYERRDPNAIAAILTSGAVEGEGSQQSDVLQDRFHQASYTAGIHLCFGNEQPKRCYLRHAPDVKAPKYGLERIGVDFSKYPAFPEADRSASETQDVYFLREPTGAVSTLVECTAEESKTDADGPAYKGVIAHCDQYFISKRLNALVQIHYLRARLKDWSEIQARWLSLLDSFALGPKGGHQTANR